MANRTFFSLSLHGARCRPDLNEQVTTMALAASQKRPSREADLQLPRSTTPSPIRFLFFLTHALPRRRPSHFFTGQRFNDVNLPDILLMGIKSNISLYKTYKLLPYILKSYFSVFNCRLSSDCLRARNEAAIVARRTSSSFHIDILIFSSVCHWQIFYIPGCSAHTAPASSSPIFLFHALLRLFNQFTLLSLSYMCEITGDGIVLAGVELEISKNGVFLPPDRRFFWAAGCTGPLVVYE
uniref:Uncharacterized protein n=1 Tax=Aegilops tauschii TaxID=37682 RepID=M8B9R9_AEGTA